MMCGMCVCVFVGFSVCWIFVKKFCWFFFVLVVVVRIVFVDWLFDCFVMGNESVSVPGYLTVLWLFLIVFIIFIIRHYANRKEFPWHSVTSSFSLHFLSFSLLFLTFSLLFFSLKVSNNFSSLFLCSWCAFNSSNRCFYSCR